MSSSDLQHSDDIWMDGDGDGNYTSVAIPKTEVIKTIKNPRVRRKLFPEFDLEEKITHRSSHPSSIISKGSDDESKRLESVTVSRTCKRKFNDDNDDDDDGQIGDRTKSRRRDADQKRLMMTSSVPLAEPFNSARHFGTATGTKSFRGGADSCENLQNSPYACGLAFPVTPLCGTFRNLIHYDDEFDDDDDDKQAYNTFRFGLASRKQAAVSGKRKLFSFKSSLNTGNDTGASGKASLKKFHSEIESQIGQALSLCDDNPDLIGDFSVPCALPLLKGGRHEDLKTISHNTMKLVLEGDFDQLIGSYQVIDCRFPYEYNGGHIVGSKNLYTKESVTNELLNRKGSQPASTGKQHILIFHCEFSVERGPKLLRFLRNGDRDLNKENYPKLLHPEIYLLEGGYKEFYQHHPTLCTPEGGYVAMKDRAHIDECAVFKSLTSRSSKVSRILRPKFS